MAWNDNNLGRRQIPGLRVVRDQLVDGLREEIHQLRQVAQHIDAERRYHLEELEARCRAVLKTTTRSLNQAFAQRGISPLYLATGYVLVCSFLVYSYTKLFRRH